MLLIHFSLVYFLSHLIECHAIAPEKIPLDSIIMSEAILHPRKSLFVPQIFLHAKELCIDQLEKALGGISTQDRLKIMKQVDLCNQTLIGTEGYLNFQDKTTIDSLCSEARMTIWTTCGNLVSTGVNKCFETYNLPPSKGFNNWQFTKIFSQIFCRETQHFTDVLLDGDDLVCTDPEKIEEILDCNKITFAYFDEDGNTDLNDFCTNFGIMEYCINRIFKDECHDSQSIFTLINLLKQQLHCNYFTVDGNAAIYTKNVTIYSKNVTMISSSKSSLPSPEFGFIVIMISFIFRKSFSEFLYNLNI